MSSIVLLSGLFMLILTWYVIVLTEGMVFVERASDGGAELQGRRMLLRLFMDLSIWWRTVLAFVEWFLM